MTGKAPGIKASEQKRRTKVPAKRWYKVRVIVQPIPTTPMPATPVNSAQTVPTSTVATTSTQMPMTKSTATSITVMVYNLAKGRFDEVTYSTGRPQHEQNHSIQNSNPPQLEAIPNTSVREATHWPRTASAPKNLFEARKDWPIPPMPAPTVKIEVPPQIAAIPHAMVMPKQVGEKCTWGLHCPICMNEKEHSKEDWNGDRQRDQPRNHYPQNAQQLQTFDVPDRYSEQIRLRKEWDEKMECLNEKYGLDYYSSLESDSNFEPEHKYETLI